MGFDSRRDFAPPTILLGLLLCPWMWGIFFGGSNILLSMVVQQRVVIFEFLAGDEHTSFFSAILSLQKTAHVGEEECVQFNMSLIKLKLLSLFSC